MLKLSWGENPRELSWWKSILGLPVFSLWPLNIFIPLSQFQLNLSREARLSKKKNKRSHPFSKKDNSNFIHDSLKKSKTFLSRTALPLSTKIGIEHPLIENFPIVQRNVKLSFKWRTNEMFKHVCILGKWHLNLSKKILFNLDTHEILPSFLL